MSVFATVKPLLFSAQWFLVNMIRTRVLVYIELAHTATTMCIPKAGEGKKVRSMDNAIYQIILMQSKCI